ncbi:hypothetical protein G7046_g9942 [Stylonectria norvegica]|nr:hypothetical protein G7046_g9942 [Stylonectria norvegica]
MRKREKGPDPPPLHWRDVPGGEFASTSGVPSPLRLESRWRRTLIDSILHGLLGCQVRACLPSSQWRLVALARFLICSACPSPPSESRVPRRIRENHPPLTYFPPRGTLEALWNWRFRAPILGKLCLDFRPYMDPPLDPPIAASGPASASALAFANSIPSAHAHGELLSTSSVSPPPAKRRRTAATLADCCRTCRLRKVKCTGNPGNGPCTNCARLELTCPFTTANALVASGKVSRTTPSHIHTEAGTLRKRAQRACSQCHVHKTKCSGDLPRCKRCEAAGMNCEYTAAKRKFANVRFPTNNSHNDETLSSNRDSVKSEDIVSPGTSNGGGNFPLSVDVSNFLAEEMLVRKDVILQHMDAYFDYIYHIPSMGFFHRETVYSQIQDGTFDPATAAGMCSIASFFVNPGEAGREFGMKCSDQVEFHVFRNIYRFAEETLILYALNGVFNFLNGSLAKVWQCFGIAIRLMLGLQVNWDVLPQSRSFAQQECLRRIVWQFFYMDRLLAGGYDEYISCRVENMKIRLPCNESAFRENRTVVVERLHEKMGKYKGAMGLHGYQLQITDIKHRILMKLGAPSGANRSRTEPSKVMADINTLQNELFRFNNTLPDEHKLSNQNITRHMASEQGPGYVFLHTCLSTSHIELYSLSLPGLREQIAADLLRKLPQEFIAKSQKQAVAHALCLARFCETIHMEVEQRPYNGKLKVTGDPTILNVVGQCQRVLLTALQHNIYQDLTDHSTAPLWRSEPADEAHIRGLIDSLLRISESWGRFLPKAQQSHESNQAAVEQFDKTRKFADQRAIGGLPSSKTTGITRLPGPHHIVENIFMGTVEEEQRSKAGDAAAADRWFRTPQPSGELVTYPLPEGGLDVEYGPPGVPVLLAQARGVSLGPTPSLNMYDAANDLLSMSSKMVPMPDFNGMMPPGNTLGLTSDGIPIMQMNDGGHGGMFQPQSQPPQPHPQFLPSQHGMFIGGYAGQYADGQSDPAPYMQQNTFG